VPSEERPPTPVERFVQFDRRNPAVFAWLRREALVLVRRGRQRLGINMLLEAFRWHSMLATEDPASEFKINNSFAPFYARKLMAVEAELAGVFELRRSVADLEVAA
jgi:hypothetical protein